MKKLFATGLCMLLLLTGAGCADKTNGTPSPSKSNSSQSGIQESSTLSTQTKKEGKPLELDKLGQLKTFTYSISSNMREESDGEDVIRYYISGDNADGFIQIQRQKINPAIDLSDKNAVDGMYNEFVSGMKKSSNVSNLEPDFNATVLNYSAVNFICDMQLNNQPYKTSGIAILDGEAIYTFLATEPESSDGILTATFPSFVNGINLYEAEDDFLKDDEIRKQISDMSQKFQFPELIALADSYIIEHSPNETDTVYAIKQSAESANAVMPNCNVVIDEFEDKYTLYGGIDTIDENTNFVPYISQKGFTFYDISSKIGFKQEGWLFFKTTKIKVSDGSYIYDSHSDPIRDVLDGGTILEQSTTELKYEDVDKILSTENPVIRFEGDNEAVRDHIITTVEIEALKNVTAVAQAQSTITDTINQWQG